MQDTLKQQKTGLILFGITFLIAPFFFQPNLGGEGLSVSHNTTVWIAATLLISAAVFTLLRHSQFVYPRYWLPLIAMPLSIILCGFLVEIFLPYQFLLRELYIIGGLLFLFALFQFRFTTYGKENLLIVLLIAGIIHALYGISQILWPGIAPTFLTYSKGPPYSSFQQINLQASYQATVLLISLYLISRPRSGRGCTSLLTGIIFSAITLSSFIIAYSGSRVGLLSALAGIAIITLSRWPQFKLRKKWLALFILAVLLGGLTGKEGLEETSVKLQQTAEESLQDSRKNIYAVALDLFWDKPVQGYGIGSFQKEWHSRKVSYMENHPEAVFPADRLSHPHNEIIFWVVEGGMLVIAGITISLIAVIIAALHCGWRRGTAYLALLLPIGLHTQVELPFYISNIPWFVMMTLLFIIFSHTQTRSKVELSRAAQLTCKTAAVATFTGVTIFMIHSIQANNAIIRFLEGRHSEPMLLQPALENVFFRDYAELYFMRTLLMREAQTKQSEFSPTFIEWAEPFIEYTPVPQLYIDLAQAYLITRQPQEAIRIIETGASVYPLNKRILNAREEVHKAASHIKPGREDAPIPPQAGHTQ